MGIIPLWARVGLASDASGERASLGAIYVLALAAGGLVLAVEALMRRRGHEHPWIYGWASSCLFLATGVALLAMTAGLRPGLSLGLALLAGATTYPVLRNAVELLRTGPRKVYVEEEGADPPLHETSYRATGFGSTSQPIRPERPQPTAPSPPPRVFRWQDANIPEARRAALVTLALLAVTLGGVTWLVSPSWGSDASDVAMVLADEGFPAARVRSSDVSDLCVAGREAPFRWSAPGVEGEACRSPSGRVRYLVTRRWTRDGLGKSVSPWAAE